MCGKRPVGEEEVIKINMALAQEKHYTTADVETLPEGVRAEVIDGQLFYLATPSRTHQELLMFLSATMWNYVKEHGGKCKVYPAPFAVYLNNDDRSYFEPDLILVCDESKIDERGCHGAPDFVAEIVSPSTRSRDYLLKLNKYQNAGVREYWIVDDERELIHVYDFEHETVLVYTFKDKVKVSIFEDLILDFSEI